LIDDNSWLSAWSDWSRQSYDTDGHFLKLSMVVDAFPSNPDDFQRMFKTFSERDRETLDRALSQQRSLVDYVPIKQPSSVRELYAAIEETDRKYVVVIGHNVRGKLQLPGAKK